MNTLLLGIAGSGKTSECIRRAGEALASGGEVLYLVPNREEAALVRARLADTGGGKAAMLPGIVTFGALVRRALGALRPELAIRGPLPRRLALSRLIAARRGRLGTLEDSAATAGFPEALEGLFSELLDGGITPDALSELPGDRPKVLSELLSDYHREQAASALLDPASAMASAALALETKPDIFPEVELFVIDGFSNLSPQQFRLVQALVPRAEETLFSLCMDPDDLKGPPRPPFERLHRLATRIEALEGWRVQVLDETPRFAAPYPARIARELFRRLPGEASGEIPEELTLLEAASRRDEAEAVAAELRRLLAGGMDAGRVAVLYRDPELGELVARSLSRANLPFQTTRKQALGRRAMAGLLCTMLDWQASGGAADLPLRLRGGYLGAGDELLLRMQAEGRLRDLPDEGRWDELFEEFRLAEPDADWDWLLWRRGLTEGPLDGAAWLAKILRPLCALVSGKLSKAFVRGDGGGLASLAEELRDLEDILSAAGDLAAGALAPGDLQTPAAWLTQFKTALESVELRRSFGGEGGGILLGNPFEMRLPELDHIFVVGLCRGSFPPPPREDPLLRESERQQINRRLEEEGGFGRLSLRADRQAEERYLFYIAATRASRNLTLSWSVRDLEGRVTPPSFFLEELGRIAPLPEPRFVPGRSLDEKLARPVDLRDLLRNTLIARSRGLGGARVDEAETFLREHGRGAELDAYSARKPVLSLEGEPRLAERMAVLRGFSPTGLESYAACPTRFLFERVLGLKDDELGEPGPREEGLLYHKMLELFFRDWDGGLDPVALHDRLAELYPKAIETLIEDKEEPAFRSRRFRVEDLRRLRVLEGFLGRDLARLSATDLRPDGSSLEKCIRVEAADLPGGDEGDDFHLRGVVDRMDVAGDGRRLVIDYKRSARTLEDPEAAAPMSFQLPVYAMSRDEKEMLGAGFSAVTDPKKALQGYYAASVENMELKKALPGKWLKRADWDAWLERVSDRIRRLVAEIGAGHFDPLPADGVETCDKCRVRLLCRWEEGEETVGGGANESS